MAEPEKKNFGGYIAFFSGQLVSLFGTSIVQFGIIFWITYETLSPFMLGIAAFLAFGAQIALTPLAGVFVDRWSRKKIIMTADGLQAAAAFVLLTVFATLKASLPTITLVWYVILVMTFRGGLGAFHGLAVEAIVPLMVPRQRLSRMNALTYLANGLIFSVGPVIGAFVYATLEGNLANILWIDVTTFLIAVIPTILVRIPRVKKKEEDSVKKKSFRREFGEGASFIRSKKGLLTLLSTFSIANFLLTPLALLLPLYTLQVLAMGDASQAVFLLGILMLVQNGGNLASAMFMTLHRGFKRNVVGVVGGLLLGATGMLLVAIAPNLGAFLVFLTPQAIIWVAAIGLAINGLTVPIANVSSQTIWQKVVPPEKLGRVFSVRFTIAQATAPFAMLVSGVAADLVGTQFVIYICACLELIALTMAWSFTSLPHVEDTILAAETIPKKDNESKE